MGWTGISKSECVCDRHGNVNRYATAKKIVEGGGLDVLRGAMGEGGYYAVVSDRRTRDAFLLVLLIRVKGGLLWYKDLIDTSGPAVCGCPSAVLDAADRLCPCTPEYDSLGDAAAWRARCRERAASRGLPTAFGRVPVGGSVVWHVPEDSGCSVCGVPLGGMSLKLPKVPRRRSWTYLPLRLRVSTRLVDPADCEPAD